MFFQSTNHYNYRLIFYILAVYILLFNLHLSASRSFITHNYQVENGLSHNTVWCALQDTYGFIWLGTSNGLNCFDGRRNVIYRSSTLDNEHTLGSNFIRALYEDNQKRIWIGTDCGIYLYNRDNQFIRFNQCTEFGVSISSEVSKIIQLPNEEIAIATLGQGIFFYNPKEGTLIQQNQYTPYICDICVNQETQRIYMTSLQSGLLCFDLNKHFVRSYPLNISTTETDNTPLRSYALQSLKGSLWIGTDSNNLFELDYATEDIYRHELHSNQFLVIQSIIPYQSDTLLLGTDKGLFYFNCTKNIITQFDNTENSDDFTAQNINALMKDAEGGIWALTNQIGAIHISPKNKQFDFYNIPNSQAIYSFCEDIQQNHIWIGTQNGLFRYNTVTKSIQEYQLADEKNHKKTNIRTLCRNGNELWIGTFSDGLKVLNLTTGKIKNYHQSPNLPNTINSEDIQKIYRCQNGDIYIGTNWGLCHYNAQEDNFRVEISLGAWISITDILEDKHHNLWIATTNNGVFYCNRKKQYWRHYEHRKETEWYIDNNSITTIFEDSKGRIWFGSNGNGLLYYDYTTEKFNSIQANYPELSTLIIYSIEEDNKENLWISSSKGLLCIKPTLDAYNWQYFTSLDGIQGGPFSERASYKMKDGTLLFGTMNGFNQFNPSSFKENTYVPPVYISELTFVHTDYAIETLKLNTHLSLFSQIELPYQYNSFTIHFSALSYQEPTKNRFSYKLKGFDSKWIENTENSEATYYNLPPGTYKLVVRGSNNDLKWNEQTAELTITITPPWYRSTWAYCCYTLLLLSTLMVILWKRDKQLKQKYNKQIENYRMEKEKELYKNKINFFIHLIHEIRTPLTLIKLPLDNLKKTMNVSEKASRELNIIDKNINYLLNTTNELLDFQRIESGAINLHLRQADMKMVVTDIYNQFVGVAQLKNIELRLNLPEAFQVEICIDSNKINKILVNLISNSIKYAQKQIALSGHTDEKRFYIQVDDDGPGIADNDKEKVFQLFYQTSDVKAIQGSGIGLAYSRSLAEAHHGTLTVTDSCLGGACFTLTLPLHSETKESSSEYMIDDRESTNADPAPETDETNMQFLKKYTVLLVEDHKELLEMEKDALEQWFNVLTAYNGLEALRLIEASDRSIDVIVSDVMMPVMDGFELCHTIKNTFSYSHIPVILLTAKVLPEAKAEGLSQGADAYVEKPFTTTQLYMQIQNLLNLRIKFQQYISNYPKDYPKDTSAVVLSSFQISTKDQEFIKKMQQIILQQLADENFSIDTLASEMNMSRSNFYRKLKALTGMAPNDYLKVCRLNRAAELLKEGHRISEVFEEIGFSSSSYFAKCFKNQFGVLPKDYIHQETTSSNVKS